MDCSEIEIKTEKVWGVNTGGAHISQTIEHTQDKG